MTLDHLFVDQDGVLTLVEVKRSSDTRIRREVVGQMLDYAANGGTHDTIRAQFNNACSTTGRDPTQALHDALGPDIDEDQFWQRVKTNLQAGRVRLVFVADDIPPELRRIVEFLNAQMDPAEVLAVEVKQFVGQQVRTLVPRVYGLTAEAEQKKGAGGPPARQWDEGSFFAELAQRGSADVWAARHILEWAQPRVTRIYWGKGNQVGSFVPILNNKGRDHQLFPVYTNGTLQLYFRVYANKPPFSDEARRRELLQRLNTTAGLSIPPEAIDKYPSVPLSLLASPETLEPFLHVFEWVIEQIRSA